MSVQVQKNLENGVILYVACLKCPRCDTTFEAIKHLLPHEENDLCDDILNQKLCTSN